MLKIEAAEQLLDIQEDSWRRGNYLTVEELLSQYSDVSVSEHSLLQLVLNELSLRSLLDDAEATQLVVRETVRRFPQIAQQIEIDQEIVGIAAEFLEADGTSLQTIANGLDESTGLPQLANYRVTELINTGAFGTVYHAHQFAPERVVAIKVLDKQPWESHAYRQNHQEADNIVRLRHPHIIEIYEVGTLNGLAYYTMPYMAQGSLSNEIEGYRNEFIRIAELMKYVAQAVAFANQFELLHCDLKPSNILLEGDKPFVADFGLALRMDCESAYSTRGTRPYMAPEQRPGSTEPLTCRTDVYGVGAVLYHLLCGRTPQDAQQTIDDQWLVAPARRINPRVPRDLDALVNKCLRSDPSQRYDSVAEVADELKRFLENRPLKVRPLGGWLLPLRLWKWARRNPVLATLASVFLVLLVQNFRLESALNDSESQRYQAAEALAAHGSLVVERALLSDAEPQYRKSVELYDELVQSYPKNPLYRLKLATAQSQLASLNIKLGKRQETRALLTAAIQSLDGLSNLPSQLDRVRDELANAYAILGQCSFSEGNIPQALKDYQIAQQIREELATLTPDRLDRAFARAQSLQEMGVLLSQSSGQSQQAEASLKAASDQLQILANKILNEAAAKSAADIHVPQLGEVVSRLQLATMALANCYLNSRQLSKAESVYVAAENRWSELLAQDPNNLKYQEFQAVVINNRGTCCIDANKLPEAIEHLGRSEAAFRRILKSVGASNSATRHLAKCKSELARAYFQQFRLDNLASSLQQARENAKQSLAFLASGPIGNPTNEQRSALASLERLMGDIEYQAGNVDAEAMPRAMEFYERSLLSYSRIVEPSLLVELMRLDLLNNVGRFYLDFGQLDKATEHLGTGLVLAAKLQTENPQSTACFTAKMVMLDALGLIETKRWEQLPYIQRESPAAIAYMTKSLAYCDEVLAIGRALELGKLEDSSTQSLLLDVAMRRAISLDRLSRYADAIAQWEISLVAPGSEERQIYRLILAGVYGRSGDYAAMEQEIIRAQPSVDKLADAELNLAAIYTRVAVAARKNNALSPAEREAKYREFNRKAITMLVQARERGFFDQPKNIDDLKAEKDLDPLRSLPAYQEFCKTLKSRLSDQARHAQSTSS